MLYEQVIIEQRYIYLCLDKLCEGLLDACFRSLLVFAIASLPSCLPVSVAITKTYVECHSWFLESLTRSHGSILLISNFLCCHQMSNFFLERVWTCISVRRKESYNQQTAIVAGGYKHTICEI